MHYMKRKLFWKGFEVLKRNITLRKFQPKGRILLLDKPRMCIWNYQVSVKQRIWPIVRIDMSCVSTQRHGPRSCQQLLFSPKRTNCPCHTAHIFQSNLHLYEPSCLQVSTKKDDSTATNWLKLCVFLAELVRRQRESSSNTLALFFFQNLPYSNMTVYKP